MKRRILTSIILAFGFMPCAAFATSAEVTQRLCTESDLAGSYYMVQFHETPKADEDAWIREFQHHYLIFESDHKYDFLASRHRITTTDDLRTALKKAALEAGRMIDRKYTLDSTGILNLYADDRVDYSYRCMVAIKAAGGDQVGDLMLTGYSKKKTELYKLFRHWP